ncbi:Zinc finger, PHD-finger [Phytophthora cactorum]|nr:Zinc finger, PHD-finger [Phytophthora cactorum]
MSSASGASDAPPPDPCCICMSLDDYQGTLLVQCARCSIRVHVKCYGVSIEGINASSWLCQAYQRDVWCHVLCINWIPELYHSLTGVMDEAVQISQYDKSRSMLRCVVCGVRGGCIQCVSGRCAKAFHVVCAFRSPSSLVFTGYNTQNQQVYHCKTHLSDVDTTKFEMVDNSWRALPEVKRYEEEHPSTNEPKCRFCGNKVTLPNKEVHETQCLLGWMARADVRKRKQELDRLGVKPVEIVYKDNEKSPAKKGKRNRSSPNARKNSREANGKFKRQETLMRPCPECGEHVRETLMMGHMRNSCPKKQWSSDGLDVLLEGRENHFYNSSVLEKKRMGQLSKSLCGVKLEDIAKALRRRLQASDIHCRDTMRLERHAEDPTQSLVLQKCTHKCDFLMRASHCRCLSDPLAKPMIEIRHNPQCTKPIANQAAGSGPIHVPDGTEANMRVQFKTGRTRQWIATAITEEEDDKKTTESEQDGSTEDEDDAVDDGTCVVCFDGQSPETNPIIFCDRCELAVHQRCYGMAKVPSNEFICDRCRATREGLDPARDVFCQLCSLSDGAFKRTVDGKWVHVVCALWCPKVWIGNLFDLSEISLVGTSSQVRFLNSVEEIKARIAQASSSQHLTPKSGDHLEVPGIELGSLCVHCRVACGRTIQCCCPGCSTSFHPLCGWYDGLPMTIALGDERYMYAGGGAGLNFQMFCSKHLPEYYPASEQLAQRRRRARFRIDSYFVMRNKDNYSSGVKKQADDESSLLSGSIVQAVLSAESKLSAPETDADVTDWTDMTVCSACFEYCAPLVGELTDANMLHRRQFMIRCQYCNVYIHPECCISDIGSSATIFRSNWICERCTQTGGNGTPECVVCAKATDYLMPCIDLPVPVNQANGKAVFDAKAAITAIRPAPGGGQQLWLLAHQNMQRQMQGQTNSGNKIPSQLKGPESNGVASHPTPNRWIHVYCSKWQKAKTVKKQHMLCAYTPTLKSDGLATRCELCDKKEGMLASCAQCNRRFHPICAAQKKLYCARSNRTDWKFYCEAHPPADAAFDANRQSWITQEILGQLQDLRRSLERGRMLLEMSRQRDRQHKRLLNLCKLPLMETSIDVILKKRPTPYMKEVYKEITGETLIDVPHRAKVAPPPSRNSRNRVRNSPRAASGGRSTEQRSARLHKLQLLQKEVLSADERY